MSGQIVTTSEVQALLDKYKNEETKNLFEHACRCAGFSSAQEAVSTYRSQGNVVSGKVVTQIELLIIKAKAADFQVGFFAGAVFNVLLLEEDPYILEAGGQKLLDDIIGAEVSTHLGVDEVDEDERKQIIDAFRFVPPTV